MMQVKKRAHVSLEYAYCWTRYGSVANDDESITIDGGLHGRAGFLKLGIAVYRGMR